MHSQAIFNRGFGYLHGRWAWILESPAWLGMVMFFTLSGYLMGKGFYTGKYDLSRPGVTLYLRNRFLRIVPLMVVVGLVIAGLLATIWRSQGEHLSPKVGVRLLLFEFNSHPGPGAIGPFWSLSTEWQYYLLVPAAFAIALAATRRFAPGPKVLLPVATLLVLGVGVMNSDYVWTHHGGSASYSAYIYPTLFGNMTFSCLGSWRTGGCRDSRASHVSLQRCGHCSSSASIWHMRSLATRSSSRTAANSGFGSSQSSCPERLRWR
jgi:peptidoglycan/LPS O-acetylase OafA/YrhL